MTLTLRQIADMINGRIIGDETLVITGVSSFYDAGPSEITFASEPKFLKQLSRNRAGAVIIPEDYTIDEVPSLHVSLIQTDAPKLNFFRILSRFHPAPEPAPGIASSAIIGDGVAIGANCTIEPNVVIGDGVRVGAHVHIMAGTYIGNNVVIGNNSMIKPNVTVMERTIIGNDVLVHSGSVLGSDGFGFTPSGAQHEKIPHAGFVQIDDRVEIGACNTIDRGTFGRTWIKAGVKTDNGVHIAHNVIIGENTLIVAQVGIAGSTSIGNNVILAGKCGISGHLTVGDNAIVGPGAGVLSNVPPGTIVSGMPQMPHKLWLKVGTILPRLPEFRKKLASLEKKINRLAGTTGPKNVPPAT